MLQFLTGKQIRQLVGMLFLHRQNHLQQVAGRRVPVSERLNQFTIAIDCDAFGHQVLIDHVYQGRAGHIFGVAPIGQAVGRIIRLSSQLHDSGSELVGVAKFLVRVGQEFIGGTPGVQSSRHEVMAAIAEHADEFGRQRCIELLQHRAPVGRIACGHRAFLHAEARLNP